MAMQSHSTRLPELITVAFGPRCLSGDVNRQEEDEEKGTFKPVEEDTFQSGGDTIEVARVLD